MKNATARELEDKLALHLQHFQDGFRTLSTTGNHTEFAEQFSRMLHAAFLSPLVIVVHQHGSDAPEVLYPADMDGDPALIDDDGRPVRISDDGLRMRASMNAKDEHRLWVLVEPRADLEPYSDFDGLVLTLFLQLLGSAWQYFQSAERDREHLFDLNSRVLQLHDLVDAGVEMLRAGDEEELLLYVLQRCVSLTDSTRGTVRVEEPGKPARSIAFPNEGPELEPSLSRILAHGSQTLTLTVSGKEARSGAASYAETDRLLVDGLTRQLQVTMENRDLQKEALEKQRYENELLVAAEIQQRLLPDKLPTLQGYQIAAVSIPAREVGGDFYDCIDMRDGRVAMVMADVAGKGMPAALLVNSLHAALHSGLRDPGTLTELMVHLNRFIYAVSTSDKFITCFLCVLDPLTGALDIVNAGHDPGIVISEDGGMRHIPAGGVALGMVNMNLPYDGQQLALEPGEGLLLFTDGIPEAMNEHDEPFGDETLEKFLVRNRGLAAEEFLSLLVDDVQRHAGNAPRSDDITALYIRRS